MIALEMFWSDQFWGCLEKVYLATRSGEVIKALFGHAKPSLEFEVLFDEFSDDRSCPAFYSLAEVEKRTRRLPGVADCSIARLFPLYEREATRSRRSRFLRPENLVDVTRFGLPETYTVVHPYSSFDKWMNRDYTRPEWAWTLNHLFRRGQPGVVLGAGSEEVPNHPRLVNLVNQTTILEAVSVLAGASGFVGIDCCFSVLAASAFSPPDLLVRGGNYEYLSRWRTSYYPHQTDASFLVRSLGA